jgi:hypothetical protein
MCATRSPVWRQLCGFDRICWAILERGRCMLAFASTSSRHSLMYGSSIGASSSITTCDPPTSSPFTGRRNNGSVHVSRALISSPTCKTAAHREERSQHSRSIASKLSPDTAFPPRRRAVTQPSQLESPPARGHATKLCFLIVLALRLCVCSDAPFAVPHTQWPSVRAYRPSTPGPSVPRSGPAPHSALDDAALRWRQQHRGGGEIAPGRGSPASCGLFGCPCRVLICYLCSLIG